MSIEALKRDVGAPRARIVCDGCGKDEVYACGYEGETPNEGQVTQKATQHGWALVKGKHFCGTCNAKRKVVPMKVQEQPKTPTRAQKREIIDMLETVYDTDAEQYKSGDTDDTVADVLGVMPGWVEEIREDLFGPAGGNENIEELEHRVMGFERDLKAILQAAQQTTSSAEKKLAELSVIKVDLAKIKKAIGARKLKAAGVK